jgi:hypothetical protein
MQKSKRMVHNVRPEGRERALRIMAFVSTHRIRVDRTNIKALLKHPEMREWLLERLDDTSLVSADIESLSPSDFTVLHDAALDVFGRKKSPSPKSTSRKETWAIIRSKSRVSKVRIWFAH